MHGYSHRYSTTGKGVVRGFGRAISGLRAVVKEFSDNAFFIASCTGGRILMQDRRGGDAFFFASSTAEVSECCVTNHLDYDLAVCCCLLLLSAHIPGFKVDSDGFPKQLGGQFNENWLKAFDWMKEHGYRIRIEQQGNLMDSAVDTAVIVRPIDAKA